MERDKRKKPRIHSEFEALVQVEIYLAEEEGVFFSSYAIVFQ
jgi:hypothetical protein